MLPPGYELKITDYKNMLVYKISNVNFVIKNYSKKDSTGLDEKLNVKLSVRSGSPLLSSPLAASPINQSCSTLFMFGAHL